MTDETLIAIICDANVLIHYFLADRRILKLVARHIGPVYVPRSILDDEVDQMDIEEATRLGLRVLDPEDAYIIQIGNQGGPLSKHDKLLMALAKNKGYICWTSDSCLKKHCEEEGISTYWGLEMMLLLCQKGHLSESAAIRTARKIQRLDSRYITPEIVDQFVQKLRDVSKGRI